MFLQLHIFFILNSVSEAIIIIVDFETISDNDNIMI